MTLATPSRRALPRHLAALACCLGVASAQAAVGAPGTATAGGSLADIPYGTTGNVFQFEPLLFVTGLGQTNDPTSVVTLNDALEFSYGLRNDGPGLLLVDYRISNVSVSASFDDLRFMIFANPDGEQVNFLDVVSEQWGAAAPSDPTRREVQAFTFNAFETIYARARANNGLTDGGPGADCSAVGGCDATLGLQWNVLSLGPQQMWTVTVGLSDDGQSISGRHLQAAGVGSPGTALTISGTSTVGIVPEPATWTLWLAGMLALGRLVGRRRATRAGF